MPIKILTVCHHGNVRSVSLAYLLKTIYKHNAIAIGLEETDSDTREMLYRWSERIICMDQVIYSRVRKELQGLGKDQLEIDNKLYLCDVGEDVWHDSNAEELRHKCLKNLKYLNLT